MENKDKIIYIPLADMPGIIRGEVPINKDYTWEYEIQHFKNGDDKHNWFCEKYPEWFLKTNVAQFDEYFNKKYDKWYEYSEYANLVERNETETIDLDEFILFIESEKCKENGAAFNIALKRDHNRNIEFQKVLQDFRFKIRKFEEYYNVDDHSLISEIKSMQIFLESENKYISKYL